MQEQMELQEKRKRENSINSKGYQMNRWDVVCIILRENKEKERTSGGGTGEERCVIIMERG